MNWLIQILSKSKIRTLAIEFVRFDSSDKFNELMDERRRNENTIDEAFVLKIRSMFDTTELRPNIYNVDGYGDDAYWRLLLKIILENNIHVIGLEDERRKQDQAEQDLIWLGRIPDECIIFVGAQHVLPMVEMDRRHGD